MSINILNSTREDIKDEESLKQLTFIELAKERWQSLKKNLEESPQPAL